MRVGGNDFWNSLHVEFDSFVGYSLSYSDPAEAWNRLYPPASFPVLALKGAPARFPMNVSHWPLQEFVVFSEEIEKKTDKFIQGFIGEGKKFVGIHLRNGPDWEIACKDLKENPRGAMATGKFSAEIGYTLWMENWGINKFRKVQIPLSVAARS